MRPHLLLSLLGGLGALLTVTIVGLVHATTGCNAVGWNDQHADLHGCDLYYPAIEWLYEQGIAVGVANPEDPTGRTRHFLPFRPINRAEFTKLVLLASGVRNPPACVSAPFPDVPKTAWFAPYICEAKKRGIISGFPDGTFKPAINVNYANGAKILVHTFKLPTKPEDARVEAYGDDPGKHIWYRPYTMALLRARAVAPTIRAFDAPLTRGEMAEMLYRLATGKNIFDEPVPTEDGDYLGFGYHPYELEFSVGLWVDSPDIPYAFAPHTTTVRFGSARLPLTGYEFSHTLQDERWSESGLFEHVKPVFVDWSIGLYVTERSVEVLKQELLGAGADVERYFGGKRGSCAIVGVEGENTEYCFVTLGGGKTLVVLRESIDTNVAYMHQPGITPIKTSDAMYARIRKSMQFVE